MGTQRIARNTAFEKLPVDANQRLDALIAVNLQLASERDPQVLLKRVLRHARDLIGATFAVLCVGGANKEERVFCASSGIDAPDRLATPRMDAGIFGRVLAGRSAHRLVDAGGDPETLGLPAGYPAVHSALAAPIASLTVVYGWICLANKLGAGEFDEDDERILSSLASLVGRIYETGSLNAELQRHTAQLDVEIAERKRSALQLLESELRFRQLAESISEVFFLVGPAFTPILYVSPAYEEIWDRTCASLYMDPGSWIEAVHPDDRERVVETIAAGGTFEIEYRIERTSGGQRWIRARGFPIRDRDGRVYRIAGIAEDITERVNLERVLRESAAAMRRGDVIARLAHIITRPDGSFQSWSETLPQLIGREPARVPASARAWLEIVHPDERERVRAVFIEAAVSGQRMESEYRLLRAGGDYIHVRQVFDPIGDSANAAGRQRWFTTLQDVTAQKRAGEELRESERRFSDMLANIQLLAVMLDREARISYCNDYLLGLTGWRRDEVIGRSWFEVFQPPDNGEVREAFESLIEGKPLARHYESEILVRGGAPRLIRWNNSVLRDPSGEVIGTASIGEDVTESKRAEREVARLNASLERRVVERTAELQVANRELEAFSFSVSHDLRAPLHAIMGYTQALKDSTSARLDEKDRHYLDRIGARGATMDQLIDDLLSLARIASADLLAAPVDLSAMATQVLSDLCAAEPARRTSLKVQAGMSARGDAGLLRIALTNLVGNAWKFSGGREVAEIEVGQLEGDGPMTTFFVRDHGAGFDPTYSQRLFGTFQRLHSQAEFEGSGIGLATVQRVIERHGGTVRAEGAVDRGATFYFTLPAKEIAAQR